MNHVTETLEDTELSSTNILAFPPPMAELRLPKPISFEDAEVVATFRDKRASIEHAQDLAASLQAQRTAAAVEAAFRNGRQRGREDGFREGFTSGTHWGMLCGGFAVALIGALIIIGAVIYLGRTAPWH